ncbi:Uroporphyrinogen-III synthase [Vibrio ruber DSM 16370]|uniref:Uroporphyrinogen-III synthase n=1 Tax=Vibrio ruber (strain DSM 16370 / JCM 11486 / BCRC 17186 / CECT 7878 / LMG 23124 / VR1) TaxID=1123498 RepID=A0A1R4LIC9_VIBR1|nr:uroporphyrinogen-III synthase [Vibrio ruber]SJN56268.1 Uroporphyrinogen-III synthase [Vibrio ruber DSM 16370]
MSVLVTRPGKPGEALCHQLQAAGIEAAHHPLIDFHAGSELVQLPHRLAQCDLVIAVSQQAVLYSQEYLNQHGLSWPSDIRYLAIGQKTAQLLSNFTQQTVNYPAVSDSENFLSLPELNAPTGLRVEILRGNGGRDLIAQQLKSQGALVNYCEVYQREMLPFNARVAVSAWQKAAVNSIIITSEQQLRFFVTQIAEYDAPWLLDQTFYVPSERIAHDARSLGIKHIIAVGSASNSDLVAAVLAGKNDRNHE